MNITAKALSHIKPRGLHNTDVLRLSVVGGGCSGMSYKMSWELNVPPSTKDRVLTFDEHTADPIKVVIDPKSMLFLEGVTLDYSDDLNDSGFKWIHPNVKHCGCGQSFR